MSRIGKSPVVLPDKTEAKLEKGNVLIVKGPKGELSERIHPDIKVEHKDNVVEVHRPTEQRRHKALHGLSRALINNMVQGVNDGFEKKLELVGIGYKATTQGNFLHLSIGYSHDITFEIPKEVTVTAETLKGKNPVITLNSIDKQLLGQVASKIRSLRPPEPYKGKGIRYQDEYIIRKAGKAASK